MRATKLILIDGLPGSGKTTTALTLAARLRQRDVATRCVLETGEEGGDHPLNVGGPLHPAGSAMGTELFARYTVETYITESLHRWRSFVTVTERTSVVQIVESYPYQNAVRILLQMDAGAARMRAYVTSLERIVRPLRPVLVYFAHTNAAQALQTIATQRGPDWTAYAVELLTDCPYARRRDLHGFDGALALMAEYTALLDELRGVTRLPVLVLTDCNGRWQVCEQRILDYLNL